MVDNAEGHSDMRGTLRSFDCTKWHMIEEISIVFGQESNFLELFSELHLEGQEYGRPFRLARPQLLP